MEYTQNYALRKPGLNEYANVGDLNFNADKIDSQMKKNQDVDGEVYNPTTTSSNAYEAGDYVINPDDGLMYVCNGTTYGTWDATKWDHTTEFEEIQKAMASGGESELADLHDVEITNPTNGQALLYDDTTEKWHNSDLPDADVTKEASGNPIELTDGADAPLVKCVTQITGYQDLHGYDKPWVGGAGKNKLPMTVSGIKGANTSGTWSGNAYTLNGVTFTIETDGDDNVTGIKANGTSTADWVSLFIPTFSLTAGNYILNGCKSGALESYRIDMTPSGTTNLNGDTAFSVSADSQFAVRCIIRQSGYTINNVMFYPMIRLASVTDPTFAPYSNICPITAYTEGTVSVVGKNMVNQSDFVQGSISFQGEDIGSSTRLRSPFIKLSPGNTYAISTNSVLLIYEIHFYDENKTWLTYRNISNTSYVLSDFRSDARYIKMLVRKSDNAEIYVSELTMFQMEKGQEVTTYQPYVENDSTTTYPSAIYRGSEDVVDGTVGANSDGEMWIVKELDGTEGFTLSAGTSVNPRRFIKSVSALGWPEADAYAVADAISDKFHYEISSIYNKFGSFRITTSLVFPDSEEVFADATEFNQWLADNHPQIAYKLATPTTSSVTPTNLPIKSLSGYNHIESTTGEMEIEYFPAKEQPLIDLIPEASNMHEYSTAEHVVGTWIDGETIYEQTYTYSGTGAANPFTTTIDMTGKHIVEVIPHYARYTYNSGQGYGECIGSELLYTNSNILNIRYVDSVPYTLTVSLTLGSTDSYDTAFTLRYTKQSTRSLAKSAPTEETKEEQVEEVKEEPTEEIKEEPTEEAKEEPEEPVEELKEEPEEETKEPETNEEEAKR